MNLFRKLSRRRRACAACVLCALAPALRAQPAPPPPPSTTLDKVIVTGNPLGHEHVAAPVSVLSGRELMLRRGSTLGDTLNGLPGVSASSFGPNASRPVIRGLDGDRVRILSNAGASLDASSLSFDHAVPIDPLVVERVEVLRGPGALLYGGGAIGGVVNTIDNRIPREPIREANGALELRLGGAERERGGAALAETGDGRHAMHVDVFGRETDDLRVPRFVPVDAAGAALPPADRVRNSAARTRGGAWGGALFFDGGRAGLALDTYDSRYGTPAEPDIGIEMKRDHLGLALDAGGGSGVLRALRASANRTVYRHREIEGDGTVGTTFDSSGNELRVELDHAPLGSVRGTLGLQWEDVDFAALGEEAFVPSTRTRRDALFALEETAWRGGRLSAGLRLERVRVRSAGDAPGAQEERFGTPAGRRFTLRSASLSNVTPLGEAWTFTVALNASERAPTAFELFADGVHAATGTFERGDPALSVERGRQLDVALAWAEGDDRLRLGVFAARYARFIALQATGASVEVPDEGPVAEFAFRASRARLAGIEIEGHRGLVGGPWRLAASGKLDVTRATNADTGEPLPRMAPLRILLGLDAEHGPWGARIELDHAARQSRVPSTDTPTPGYTLVNLAATRRFAIGDNDGVVYVKVGNLGDRLAYSASTAQTVRGLAPLAGRSVKLGVRVAF